MAAKRDYYEVLGVGRSATQDDIKRAFRRRARETHPDVNSDPDAEARFKEVNEAWAVLSDPQKRAAYDRFGHQAVNGNGYGDPFAGFGGFGSMADIFDELFGMGMRSTRVRNAPRRGQDIAYELNVTFEDAIFGTEKSITFQRTETCSVCDGSGAEPGTQAVRCPTCSGSGEVRHVRQTILGQMVNIAPCSDCNGTGEQITHACHNCHGRGQVRNERTLAVSVPAGVDEGTRIQISGEGEPGSNGGPNGHLMIVISVTPHEVFQRRGHDLILKLRINVAQAALGDRVTIPILTDEGESESELTIPAGTQSGEVITLKRRGVPRLRRDGTHTGSGDLLVPIEVIIPDRLTREQRELFQQLSETLEGPSIPPAHEKSFVDRVMDWFTG